MPSMLLLIWVLFGAMIADISALPTESTTVKVQQVHDHPVDLAAIFDDRTHSFLTHTRRTIPNATPTPKSGDNHVKHFGHDPVTSPSPQLQPNLPKTLHTNIPREFQVLDPATGQISQVLLYLLVLCGLVVLTIIGVIWYLIYKRHHAVKSRAAHQRNLELQQMQPRRQHDDIIIGLNHGFPQPSIGHLGH